MNEDIKQQFAKEALEVMQIAKNGVLKGIEVASVQVPDILQQLLRFKLFESVFIASIIVSITFVSIFFCAKYGIKYAYADDEKSQEVFGAIAAISSFVSAVALLFSALEGLPNIITAAQIIIAPKVYLIEYLSEFVKG